MKQFLFFVVLTLAVVAFCEEEAEAPVVKMDHKGIAEKAQKSFFSLTSFSASDKLPKEWVVTKNKDYKGEWKVEAGSNANGIEGDRILIAQNEARKHGISTKFDKAFETTEGGLLIQYETRFNKQLTCAGSYLKLLQDFKPNKFSGDDNYVVMFGPDKCGGTNKVHFIYKKLNPKTEEWEEHALKNPPSIKNDVEPHVYTLVVDKENKFELFVDGESKSKGDLVEDFDGWQEEEIDDPEDKKPEDWVDEPMMEDPEDEKPEDWVEEEMIEDENAEEPEDWDEDEDGEWERPMIANPDYKGDWKPKKIDNPEYKGEWAPKKIKNEAYYVDENPWKLSKIFGVGIEIWTMDAGLGFDNIIVGDATSKDAALEYIEKTWKVRKEAQKDYKEWEEEQAKTETESDSESDSESESESDSESESESETESETEEEVEEEKPEKKEL
ncbi:calreticulin and calnexin [Anaeramoeba flamelloides]|uniref:Calreticulin and calnexin n=1 Tax=Anaeramoeba flamelloides TaxID=1746091 RepID=A0ABQ8Y6S6_9EUKA|nr:calreticulin and calnexin [Anaeramoeba flamelloides]